jgi:quinol monooxygenase YgiN
MGVMVIACYRPKPGAEAALRELVARHVPALRSVGLATARVPVVMTAADGTVVEVFEWASREAIEQAHTNPTVLALWEEFGKVCDFVPLAQVAEAGNMFAEFTPLDAGTPS